MKNEEIIKATKTWLEKIVIDLQLCPFAKKPFVQKAIRYKVSEGQTDEDLIAELITECKILDEKAEIETSLIIYNNVLEDYFDYGQFIDWANSTLKNNGWQGIYQIATFHPQYVFANTQDTDRENFTNRSPYPIIHLLREDALQAAIDNFPNTETIPEKNIETMKNLSQTDIKTLFYYLKNLN